MTYKDADDSPWMVALSAANGEGSTMTYRMATAIPPVYLKAAGKEPETAAKKRRASEDTKIPPECDKTSDIPAETWASAKANPHPGLKVTYKDAGDSPGIVATCATNGEDQR